MENQSNSVSDVIIWLSPVAGILITWFISSLVNETKSKIDTLDKSVNDISKDVVKIKSDIEHIKEHDKLSPEQFEAKATKVFEDNVVRVIKRKLGKFE
jgi:uncharacterized protein YoxC